MAAVRRQKPSAADLVFTVNDVAFLAVARGAGGRVTGTGLEGGCPVEQGGFGIVGPVQDADAVVDVVLQHLGGGLAGPVLAQHRVVPGLKGLETLQAVR